MASLPIERSNIDKNALLVQHYNQPEYDSVDDANQQKHETLKKPKDHPMVTFYCDFHKKVFKLAFENMNKHFKAHEEEILLLSDYEKVASSRLMDVYEKTFDDDALVMDPFEQENLHDIVDLVRVGGSLMQKGRVIISFKVLFESIDHDFPKFTWMSMPQFQVNRNELGLANKIQEMGKVFLQSLLDLDSIDDSGSGWVYLGMSVISIKVIRSAKFGCNEILFEHSDKIMALVKKRILYNPDGVVRCFQKCVSHFLQDNYTDSNSIPWNAFEKDNLKATVTLEEIEEWSLKCSFLKIQIFALTKGKSNSYNIHPIFISHSKSYKCEISLLAVYNENNNNIAHFMRILDIGKLFRQTNFKGSHKKYKICQYCYNFNSDREHVLDRHELNCLENPNSTRNDKISSERIVFPAEKTYLKCRNECCRKS